MTLLEGGWSGLCSTNDFPWMNGRVSTGLEGLLAVPLLMFVQVSSDGIWLRGCACCCFDISKGEILLGESGDVSASEPEIEMIGENNRALI